MRFSLQREVLLKPLAQVVNVVERRQTLPVLANLLVRVQDGQLSFEERMGCGFGACMGCSCKTKYGYKRICKEGPVLTKDEIIW